MKDRVALFLFNKTTGRVARILLPKRMLGFAWLNLDKPESHYLPLAVVNVQPEAMAKIAKLAGF